MKLTLRSFLLGSLALCATGAFGDAAALPLDKRIEAAGFKITRTDKFLGGTRYTFLFQGDPAWIVAPTGPEQKGKWIWVTKWPGAFADGTGQKLALQRGYHYIHLEDNKLVMNDAGVKRAKAFYDLVTEKLGFAKGANLIGMSWGGFYATRFASTYPECVSKIYLDAPLLNFGGYNPNSLRGADRAWGWKKGENWKDRPAMPVNRAAPIAKAGIPVLFLYGTKDTTVPPADNADLFIPKFRAAGGKIHVVARPYNHHPHGFKNAADAHYILDFFEQGLKAVANVK